jgi:hypothetical protein
MVFISQTLIIRDADDRIIDTIEIDADTPITRADVRAILKINPNACAIERVETTERRPQ